MEKIPKLVEKIFQPEGMVFVLGAGDINRSIPDYIKRLKRRNWTWPSTFMLRSTPKAALPYRNKLLSEEKVEESRQKKSTGK